MIKKYLLALFLGITVLVFNGCGNTDTYRPTYQGDYTKGRISYFSRYENAGAWKHWNDYNIRAI